MSRKGLIATKKTVRRPHEVATISTAAPTARRSPRGDRGKRHVASRLPKVLIGIGLVITTVAVGGQWLLHQSIFRVQHVTVIGEHHETLAQVLAVSGLEQHPTMAGLSQDAVAARLSVFPWIDAVTISKHWPNTVVVTIRETAPVAVAFGAKHQLQFVNVAGRDLGAAPINANYPTLVYENPTNSSWPFARAGRSAAYVASELPKAFSAQVSQILVDARGNLTLKMTTPVSFILGPPTQLRAKFVAIASVIAHTTLRSGDVVDVTVPDELAVTGPAPS